jgi:hypothetical protein
MDHSEAPVANGSTRRDGAAIITGYVKMIAVDLRRTLERCHNIAVVLLLAAYVV